MAQSNITTPSSPNKYIIILGGSYGGLSTAHYLLKHAVPRLPDQKSYQVILISSSSQVICRPACPRALISDSTFNQDKLFVSIPEQFKQYPNNSFRFIHGTAASLDCNSRTVTANLFTDNAEETFTYYALIFATGASTPSPLHGLNASDASVLRKNWKQFRAALPKSKSIIIAGGGPAGIETAGELGEYLNGRAGWFSSKPAYMKCPITVVTSGPKILPLLRPQLAAKAEKYLAKVGVTILTNSTVKSVEPRGAGTHPSQLASKATLTLEDGRKLEADLYIPATGMVPNTSFINESLLTSNGRVETNSSTLRVEKAGQRVYAIGDCASYSRPAIHLLMDAVPVLCGNIQRDLLLASDEREKGASQSGEDRHYKEDTRETQLVPIGKSKGVGAVMGYQLPSFMVWLIKGRDYWLWTTGGLWSGKMWSKEK